MDGDAPRGGADSGASSDPGPLAYPDLGDTSGGGADKEVDGDLGSAWATVTGDEAGTTGGVLTDGVKADGPTGFSTPSSDVKVEGTGSPGTNLIDGLRGGSEEQPPPTGSQEKDLETDEAAESGETGSLYDPRASRPGGPVEGQDDHVKGDELGSDDHSTSPEFGDPALDPFDSVEQFDHDDGMGPEESADGFASDVDLAGDQMADPMDFDFG